MPSLNADGATDRLRSYIRTSVILTCISLINLAIFSSFRILVVDHDVDAKHVVTDSATAPLMGGLGQKTTRNARTLLMCPFVNCGDLSNPIVLAFHDIDSVMRTHRPVFCPASSIDQYSCSQLHKMRRSAFAGFRQRHRACNYPGYVMGRTENFLFAAEPDRT